MNTDIVYTLIRADRKSVAIKIGDGGEVIVRAPRRMSRSAVDSIVEKHKEWIARHLSETMLRAASEAAISAEDEKALRAAAKQYLTAMTLYYTELTGMRPEAVKISGAKKRFGSCSSSGSISYSYLLMLYPVRAIEYVVLHELCHLRFMDHSENFYTLVEKYMPDWKERKKLLRSEFRKSPAEALKLLDV